jgi:hypothetical protein
MSGSLSLIGAGCTCCCAAASLGKRDAGCGNAISRAHKNGSPDFSTKASRMKFAIARLEATGFVFNCFYFCASLFQMNNVCCQRELEIMFQ